MSEYINGSTDILGGSVIRYALNTTTPNQAVIRKIIAGNGITISSTGVDPGTGDVTISIDTSSTGGSTSGGSVSSGGDCCCAETGGNAPVGVGTVTSINMTAPEGMFVVGAPITTAGTISLRLSSGYVIPLYVDVQQGKTAFTWGDHALAGYLKAEIDTLDSVSTRGNTTTNSITVANVTATSYAIANTFWAYNAYKNNNNGNMGMFFSGQDIIFQTGQASSIDTVHLFGTTQNVSIGSATDPGFKFYVNGTTKLNGDVTIGSPGNIVTTNQFYGRATNFTNGIFVGWDAFATYLGYQMGSTPVHIGTGGTGEVLFRNTGGVKVESFAGSGTRMVVADSAGALSTQTVPTGSVTGSGTTNYVTKWTGTTTLGTSVIFDNGNIVAIGTATPNSQSRLTLMGTSTYSKSIVLDSTWDYQTSFAMKNGIYSTEFNLGGATKSAGEGGPGSLQVSTYNASTLAFRYPVTFFANGNVAFAGPSGSVPSDNGSTVQINGNLKASSYLASGLSYFLNNCLYTYISNHCGSVGYIGFGFNNATNPAPSDTVFDIYQGAATAPNSFLFTFKHSLLNTSGNQDQSIFSITTTINRSSSTSGIVRGIYYNPTITAVNGTHYAYESTSGKIKVSDLSGTGDRFVVADSTGVLTTATIGSGLSYSGGVLSATGGAAGTVTGSGTAGKIVKFNSASDIGNSIMTETTTLITVAGSVNATSFIKSGGTSTQFLMADGSVTTSTFLTSGSFVSDYDSAITGLRNSSNKVYTLTNNYQTGTTKVYVNGVRYSPGSGNDYTESAANQITFANAPDNGDLILVDYIKS